jgi:hypothetical protein
MALRRGFSLILGFAVLPFWPALAQQWQGPPPACQQLITVRDETQKHGQVLSEAGRRKAPPYEVCNLFKVFIASETRMVNGLEENAATCGVPLEVIKQVKAQYSKARQMAERVCDVAGQSTTRGMPLRFDAPPPHIDAPAPGCSETTLRPGVPCIE